MKYAKLKYNKLGKNGDVVFFLHGYGGNKNSLEKLAKSACDDKVCYLFDLYGFGETNMPEKSYDIYDYATSIYLFCVNKGIKKVSIVAHSFGGRIGLILASVFDLNVEKLVLIDSAGLRPRYGFVYYLKIWQYKIAKKICRNKIRDNRFGSDEYKKSDKMMRLSYLKVVNQHLDYLLKYVNSKTFIIWGRQDKDTPQIMAKKMYKNIQSSILKVYNGDHFIYVKKHPYIKKDIKSFLCGDCTEK